VPRRKACQERERALQGGYIGAVVSGVARVSSQAVSSVFMPEGKNEIGRKGLYPCCVCMYVLALEYPELGLLVRDK